MPRSFGFWLDPTTGQVHEVRTHQDWLLENASLVGLEDAVVGFDPQQDQDAIRLIGVRAGLVRIRDYGARMSVQFWSEPDRVAAVLCAVRRFLPKAGVGPLKKIWVNNLANNDQVTVTIQQFMDTDLRLLFLEDLEN